RGAAHHGEAVELALAAAFAPHQAVGKAMRAAGARIVDVLLARLAALEHQLMALGRVPERLGDLGWMGQGFQILAHDRRSRTRLPSSLMLPPLPLPQARRGFLPCRASPRPINCRIASVTWLIPPASPGCPNESCPPWVLH